MWTHVDGIAILTRNTPRDVPHSSFPPTLPPQSLTYAAVNRLIYDTPLQAYESWAFFTYRWKLVLLYVIWENINLSRCSSLVQCFH